MKKNQESVKKLEIHRESLRVLSAEKELKEVAGGTSGPTGGSLCHCVF